MKTVRKIAGRVVAGVLLTLYVAVAALNYSVVQSYLGAAAGRYFSQQWGGELHIGALHAMPWDHLMLNNVRLVAPDGDTILDVRRMRVRFKRFPYEANHLKVDRVALRDGYYHLAITHLLDEDTYVTNLQHIFDCYATDDTTSHGGTFTVDVGRLDVRRLRYKQDLPDEGIMHWQEGVDIAHMDFRDINVRARDIHVVNDDVSVRLLKFNTTERSGMRVDQVEADVHVSPTDITVRNFELYTPQSTVKADVEIRWDGWGGHDYLADVQHDIVLHEGTSVALADAAYWAPVLWGINATINAEGRVKGTIGDMHISDFAANWGNGSMLQLTGDVRGLPDIGKTVFDVDIERLRTTADDVRALGLDKNEKPTAHYALVDLPDMMLKELDHVDMSLRLHGGWEELGTLNMQMESGLGNLHADALLTPLPQGGARFSAEVGSNGLGLKMLRTDWLSHTGFDMSVSGALEKWNDPKTLRAELDGRLTNSVVRGHHLAPVAIDGEMEAGVATVRLESTDSLALVNAEAELALLDSVKALHCVVAAKQIDGAALGLTSDPFGTLATRAEADYHGSSLDEMEGWLRMRDTRIGDLRIDNLALDVSASYGEKLVRMESDAVDATVRGRFGYMDLPLMWMDMAHEVLPQDLFHTDTLYPQEAIQIANSDLHFHANWHDRRGMLHVVAPDLDVANGTRVDGSYNGTERLKLVLRSDSLGLGAVRLREVGLSSRMEGDVYAMEVEASEAAVGAVKLMNNARLRLGTNSRRLSAGLAWDSDDGSTEGDIAMAMEGGHVEVMQGGFTVGDRPWELSVGELDLQTDGGLRMQAREVGFKSEAQWVTADISLMGMPSDNVELHFHDFELQDVADLALQSTPMTVGGALNGRFSLYGVGTNPYFNANLTVDSCHINRQAVGDVQIASTWNAELNTASVTLTGDQLAADGWIELGRSNPEMNFNVDFDGLDLSLVAPLLADFSSRFEGWLHGNFDITGTLKAPLVVGEAMVERGALQVDMTGITYYFDDSIQFTNNLILLDRFVIADPQGNTALVEGNIRYSELSDIALDLRLRTDRLMVLDKAQGDEFYGTLVASADGTVQGPVDALEVNVSARTQPGCTLTVPVNDSRQVKAQDYIVFVGDNNTAMQEKRERRKEQNLKLDVELAITPDVQLNLPMDFSEVTVKVGASGAGDLHLSMAGSMEPQVVGSYEITSGTMKVGLISLIEKTFSLENGSSLNFQGSLPDAQFDLSAVYSQRVNLSTLTGGVSDVGGTQKYLQVEDVINIAGTLRDPTIGFDIRLPGADASVEEEVFAYIDRNSERDMLNQAVSLLVTGHFYNANASSVNGGIAASGSIGALSSILTDMVSVVDIDVDYKAGNELTKDQVDVNISKDWGRWYLESTLGYGGESRELQTGDANTAVIDALLGYRISPLVHLFAYNRTNTNDYTRMDLPYKQGVGLKLTKDFDRWSDLLKKKK